MKKFKLILAMTIMVAPIITNAQTAEEIIDTYFENIGGMENFKNLEGIKMIAKVNQQGMEIPLEIVQLKDGRQMTIVNFQGKQIMQ
ncbi:MAG: outer membrane lipoprotein-sorting protein, partial [Eudoraea sp.]|nr:outer membrane lipoprotein-sorting protein [Eudoraea sp.]